MLNNVLVVKYKLHIHKLDIILVFILHHIYHSGNPTWSLYRHVTLTVAAPLLVSNLSVIIIIRFISLPVTLGVLYQNFQMEQR